MKTLFEIVKYGFLYFVNPPKKWQKAINWTLIVIILISIGTISTSQLKSKSTKQEYVSEKSFDNNKEVLKKSDKKAKEAESSIKANSSDSSYGETQKGFENKFYVAKNSEAQDPNFKVVKPQKIVANAIENLLSKDGETNKDKEVIQDIVFLKAGETQYVYENMLAKTFNLNVNIGFNPYKGNLYIGPGVPQNLQQPIQDRAQDIWKQSELSARIDKLTIKFVE